MKYILAYAVFAIIGGCIGGPLGALVGVLVLMAGLASNK